MATPDIKNSSKSPDTTIIKQGHTKLAGEFGSDPNYNGPGGKRTATNIDVPLAKG